MQSIDNLLNYSRGVAGELPLSHQCFNLRDVVETVTSEFLLQSNQKQVKLILSYSDECPRFVIGDPHRMGQILASLLNNALKFTLKGHVLISIELVVQTDEQVEIQLVVEDTGVGIAGDKLSLIFENNPRMDYSAKKQDEGVGLAVVKQYVESMGGTLGMHSQADQGSTFYCTIPFELPNILEIKSQWQRQYSHIRLLIIDDYAARAEQLLESIGTSHSRYITSHEIDIELKEAKEPYQIVLVDDEINPDYLFNLSERFPGALLLLLQSDVYNKELVLKTKQAGYVDYLMKPVQPAELTNVLSANWEEWHTAGHELTQAQHQPSVLLAEDNPISHKILKMMLEKLNCRVQVAETGEEALEALLANDFDIAFIDLGLPDIDGFTLAKKINKMQVKKRTISLIALSAHITEADQQQCQMLGMQHFITKPASPQTLKEVVEACLP